MTYARRHWGWLGWIIGLVGLVGLACNMQPQPTPLPSATPPPAFCLPFTGAQITTQRPADPVAYQTTILDFLNRGGNPNELEVALRQWNVIDNNLGGLVDATQDLNDDRRLDVLVTLHYPVTAAALQPPGQLLIFGCSGPNSQYEVLYGYASAPDSGQSMPQISYIVDEQSGPRRVSNGIQDITLDGLPEIIFTVEQCTRLACFREPIILTWDRANARFRTLSDPFEEMYTYTDDLGRAVRGLPNAGLTLQYVASGQPPNVVIAEGELYENGTAATVTQREIGPFRPITHTWTWHGVQYLHTAVTPKATGLYIYMLRDADQALIVSDLDDAIQMYQEAITHGRTWGGITETAENHAIEKQMLDAYARYRLVIAYTALRDQRARDTLLQMQQERPWQSMDTPSQYTLLATTFYDTFQGVSMSSSYANALGLACERVRQVASTQAPLTYQYLGDPAYYGMVLDDYSVEDLCPF